MVYPVSDLTFIVILTCRLLTSTWSNENITINKRVMDEKKISVVSRHESLNLITYLENSDMVAVLARKLNITYLYNIGVKTITGRFLIWLCTFGSINQSLIYENAAIEPLMFYLLPHYGFNIPTLFISI